MCEPCSGNQAKARTEITGEIAGVVQSQLSNMHVVCTQAGHVCGRGVGEVGGSLMRPAATTQGQHKLGRPLRCRIPNQAEILPRYASDLQISQLSLADHACTGCGCDDQLLWKLDPITFSQDHCHRTTATNQPSLQSSILGISAWHDKSIIVTKFSMNPLNAELWVRMCCNWSKLLQM